MIFIGMDASKPALRTEGLLPAQASASRKLLAACLLCCACSLEGALKQEAAELERRGRDWAAREAALSSGHSRSHGAAAAAHAELGVAQDALDAAAKRVRALEGDNAELRKQKAQVAADKRMLEELLADGDAERRWAGGGGGGGGGGGQEGRDRVARGHVVHGSQFLLAGGAGFS